jgi:signal transduction histidine kinase
LERTPSGGRVSVRAQGLRVQVEDDGLPIPPSELERAFTLGFRNPRAAEGEEGLGLGLFIARELLAAHGAELASEALPGRGSRFSFTLPPA